MSLADSIFPGDSNGKSDVFVRDTQTGAVNRVSTDSYGGQANDMSNYEAPAISADGRLIAFASYANNLVPGDSNSTSDVFLKDTSTGLITRISTDVANGQANSYSEGPSISSDGRYVAFYSGASNLVQGDLNSMPDIFVKDTWTGAINRASSAAAGEEANSASSDPSISGNGRFVAFSSYATNIVPGVSRGIFMKDMQTGAITCISSNNNLNDSISVSADGRYVAFGASGNLPSGVHWGIFVKDNQTGSLNLASATTDQSAANADSWSPSISNDGRYVAFRSGASNLAPGSTNQTFVKDMQTGQLRCVSTNLVGSVAYSDTYYPSISGDGRYVIFESSAWNLVPNTGSADVFLAATGIGSVNSKPDLSLTQTRIYWSSYSDYLAHTLSVDLSVANNGPSPAYLARITGSNATHNVTCQTVFFPSQSWMYVPGFLDLIKAGASNGTTVKYSIPSGVGSFKTNVTATAADSGGQGYSYP
ncbi:MAG: hypothetical protein WC911_06380 [Thermoleophilia bacterium]